MYVNHRFRWETKMGLKKWQIELGVTCSGWFVVLRFCESVTELVFSQKFTVYLDQLRDSPHGTSGLSLS